MVALAKSPNKHNRLFAAAEPLGEVADAIESGVVSPAANPKTRARVLADEFGWDITDARKLWCFGPDASGPNVLVDRTTGIQYLAEAKMHIVAGFQWASRTGVLADETMRGIRINLVDVTV